MTLGHQVYEHYVPAGKGAGLLPLVSGCRVLEVGFGSGALLQALSERDNEVVGIDVGADIVSSARQRGFHVFQVDASEEPFPFDDDSFDAVYCYEVFEHLTNPHHLFYEIRRVLKREGLLFFSVPAQEIDMGYGPNRHTFVYPGLLEKPHLERFFMQMYFRIEFAFEPGDSDWLIGHNYILLNMKSQEKPDVLEVITQDVSIPGLYEEVLSKEALASEIARELGFFRRMLLDRVAKQEWPLFSLFLDFLLKTYPGEYAFYFELAEDLGRAGELSAAKKVLSQLIAQPDIPTVEMNHIRRLLKALVSPGKPA